MWDSVWTVHRAELWMVEYFGTAYEMGIGQSNEGVNTIGQRVDCAKCRAMSE
jgi:hypothetical protein